MIDFSEGIKAKMEEIGLSAQNVVVMTMHHNEMQLVMNEEKKVDFRLADYYYLRKVVDIDQDFQIVREKPVKALLIQQSLSQNSSKILVELQHWFIYDKSMESEQLLDELKRQELISENLTLNEDYIVFVLGKLYYTEGI